MSNKVWRFFVSGLCASGVYYVVGVSLDFLGIIPTMAANSIAYAFGFVASYTMQKFWTFRDASSHRKALPRFLLSSGAGFLLNSLFVWACLSIPMPYYMASFLATALVAVFSFFVQRFLVFTQQQ